jgi:hypothetical protein
LPATLRVVDLESELVSSMILRCTSPARLT